MLVERFIMKNKITALFLNFLLFLLSYIIPKKKDTFLFGSGGGNSFKGNPKYLYLYMIKNKEKTDSPNVIWITSNKKVYIDLKNNNLSVVFKFSLKSFFTVLKSEFIIIDQSTKDFSFLGTILGNFNIIQTWHGTPLKKIGLDSTKKNTNLFYKVFDWILKKEFKNYKMIISSSNEVSKRLKKAFLNNKVLITGYPRNDIFYNQKLSCENLKNKLNLSKYSKIISYLPTFRDVETTIKPFSNKGIIKLNEYLKKKNYLFLLKKHPFDKNFQSFQDLSNIKDFTKEIDDVQEILIYTDLLITDYSSVFFDYMLTNNPVIYYSYDYEEYLKNCRGIYYNYYEELPGPFARNEEELYNLISTNSWFKKKEYKKKYKEFNNKFNKYQDGKSCERLIKKIGVSK